MLDHYDPSLPGLAYVLKFINEPLGDWDLRHLDLFLSPAERHQMNSRQRRRLARHITRIQANKLTARGAIGGENELGASTSKTRFRRSEHPAKGPQPR